jgi:hypothetical protein
MALSDVTDVPVAKEGDEIVPDVGLNLLEVRPGDFLAQTVLLPTGGPGLGLVTELQWLEVDAQILFDVETTLVHLHTDDGQETVGPFPAVQRVAIWTGIDAHPAVATSIKV